MADAVGIRRVGEIIQAGLKEELLEKRLGWVVVSAIGKTTNALEAVLDLWLSVERDDYSEALASLNRTLFHLRGIATDLELGEVVAFEQHAATLISAVSKPGIRPYNVAYDWLVGHGELLSSAIVAAYLTQIGLNVKLVDARQLILTTPDHRRAQILWEETKQALDALQADEGDDTNVLYMTQGFIGASLETGAMTTLGREGSDYTASALAYLAKASALTVWKDVEGVMTADPRLEPNAQVLKHLSYDEALEMTFFGATVIHPRTIQPLQRAGIPMHVRSFLRPEIDGTTVTAEESDHGYPPLIIRKRNQVLLTFKTRNLDFMAEDHLSAIFQAAASHGVSIHLSQTSALSLSIVVEEDFRRLAGLVRELRSAYFVAWKRGLELLTIRHYTEAAVSQGLHGRVVLLEQRSGRHTDLMGQWVFDSQKDIPL